MTQAFLLLMVTATAVRGGGAPLQPEDIFAEACVRRWTALGTNSWMLTTDGKAHYKGSAAFDGSADAKRHADGEMSTHLTESFDMFRSTDAWRNLRWNARQLTAHNARLRGVAECPVQTSESFAQRFSPRDDRPRGSSGPTWACSEIFLPFFLPRVPHAERSRRVQSSVSNMASCLPSTSPTPVALNESETYTVAAKARALDELFDSYYADLDRGHYGRLHFEHTPASVPAGFPRLAQLYASLADLHPFVEANSRSRLLVLQTELVRLGGHPLMLEELGWGQYYYSTERSLQAFLLTGWCAWEYAQANGASPYPAGYDVDFHATGSCCAMAAQDGGKSTRHATYVPGCMPMVHSAAYWNPESGTCTRVALDVAAEGRLPLGATSAPLKNLAVRDSLGGHPSIYDDALYPSGL
jgi:hypothetical protein